ncbi:putative chromatin remodeler Bromodomain family [Medicago truncatula]|nr:putative chromatin remodeler Bromodomain family [Medicago truncatula]
MPEKHILESVLDVLQRNDPDELFAKPVNNPNMIEDYYKDANTPLDFSGIRAKINEERYISLEAFKFDVYLLCCNAMYANDKYSRPYQVAEAIQSVAIRVFEDISVDGFQRFHLESLPTNAPLAASSTIPQVEPSNILGHARFRRILHSENNNGTPSTELIIRDIPKPRITPQVVGPSLEEAATRLDNEHCLVLCLGDSSSDASNNVSDTQQPNAQASGSFLLRQENSTPITSLLSYQDNRESNTNGGGRQHNTSTLIPIFVDKNVASNSKDVVGAGSSQIGIFPLQDANYARKANPNSSFTSQHETFQGFSSPSIISFNQTNEKGLFQSQEHFSTFPINGYSDLQMKLGLLNPMGPFPMLKHSMSSESGPIPQEFFPSSSSVMRGNMNQSEEKAKGKGKEKDGGSTSRQYGDFEELDLDLKI